MVPCSTRPVTTVPRPWIEKTSSIGIKKGLSSCLTGSGMYSSTASISFIIAFFPISSLVPCKADKADPRMIGISSPGNL
uniref:Uncharacterized protein n=2 Tax=Arundo donax TaxID=35708 RepID=A0A0A9CMJ9_ARUDO